MSASIWELDSFSSLISSSSCLISSSFSTPERAEGRGLETLHLGTLQVEPGGVALSRFGTEFAGRGYS